MNSRDGSNVGVMRQRKRDAWTLSMIVNDIRLRLHGSRRRCKRRGERCQASGIDGPHGHHPNTIHDALAMKLPARRDVETSPVVADDLVPKLHQAAREPCHDNLHAALVRAVALVPYHGYAHAHSP